jgi:DNA repair protein RecN (Recombination protein N)
MLTELRIRNLAVIESVTLPIAPGFNVLSGETGAGKSIIVGALGLLLGERGSAEIVRSGADRATVEGIFDAGGQPEVQAALDERGIAPEDGVLLLRREVSAAGKSRAWINDTSVTTGALASLGRLLVNLHGQHESQALLREDAQREALDALAGATDVASAVRTAHAELDEARAAIAELERRRDQASRRADYLRHVVRELEEARLVEGEVERLDDEARRLTHAVELRQYVREAIGALDEGEGAAAGAISQARKAMQHVERLDPDAARFASDLDAVLVSVQELARDLGAYESTLDSDPARLGEVERRRDAIHDVTRKHGGSATSALSALKEARAELDVLDTAGLDLKGLAEREQAARRTLNAGAARLTALRKKAARSMASDIERMMPDLGLPNGRFEVELQPLAEPGPVGGEGISFLVTLNAGLDSRPLARTASGGELSRIMLALKTILARLDRVPTLVFDEVDSGIGGTVALQVGDALRHLASHHQVLVITHLAQVAARAHHHVVVAKGVPGGVSTSDISVVTGEERVAEVSRMLGGDPGSEVSRAHARELLEAAAGTETSRSTGRRKTSRRNA